MPNTIIGASDGEISQVLWVCHAHRSIFWFVAGEIGRSEGGYRISGNTHWNKPSCEQQSNISSGFTSSLDFLVPNEAPEMVLFLKPLQLNSGAWCGWLQLQPWSLIPFMNPVGLWCLGFTSTAAKPGWQTSFFVFSSSKNSRQELLNCVGRNGPSQEWLSV